MAHLVMTGTDSVSAQRTPPQLRLMVRAFTHREAKPSRHERDCATRGYLRRSGEDMLKKLHNSPRVLLALLVKTRDMLGTLNEPQLFRFLGGMV